MYKKFVTPVYILNIIFQSLFNLVTPAALMFFIARYLDSTTEVGGWIYAVLITAGVLFGFFMMISFIIKASAALEAIEKQNSEKMPSVSKHGTSSRAGDCDTTDITEDKDEE